MLQLWASELFHVHKGISIELFTTKVRGILPYTMLQYRFKSVVDQSNDFGFS
jgi:hypothetical protein